MTWRTHRQPDTAFYSIGWYKWAPVGVKRYGYHLTWHLNSERYILVLGGSTYKTNYYGFKNYRCQNTDTLFLKFIKSIFSVDKIPTNDVHLYDFKEDVWASTHSQSSSSNRLKKFRIARANHACASYEEEGRLKVIIAGGIIMEGGRFKATNTTEILDFASLTWIMGHHLRAPLTGGKFIDVQGRPTLVGRSKHPLLETQTPNLIIHIAQVWWPSSKEHDALWTQKILDGAFDKAILWSERLSDCAWPAPHPLGGDHGVLEDVQDKPRSSGLRAQ